MKKTQFIGKDGKIKEFDIHKKWSKKEDKEFLKRLGVKKNCQANQRQHKYPTKACVSLSKISWLSETLQEVP